MSDHLHLKDHSREARIFFHRAVVMGLLVVSLAGVLIYRYYNLQVVQHEDYVTESDRNRIHVKPIPPTRGLIFDRNGVLLADNRPSFTLSLIKERIKDLPETLAIISDLIDVSESDLEKFEKNLSQYRRPFEAVPLRYQLTEIEMAKLAANEYRLEGVEVEAQLVRYYPLGELFAHSVGYVGRINDREVASFDEEQKQRYSGTYSIGKIGLEKQYESRLLGEVGYQHVETNARGRVLKELEREDPQPGEDLHLFIDADVQKAAVDALAGYRGAVVAVDVRNGGVIAMASTPSFDPNLFVTGISFKDYAALRESKDIPLFDRTIQGQYPPGSTLKPMIGLGGLHTGIISSKYTINDIGYFQLPGEERRYRDHISWGHGKNVDLETAIIESCNTYYYDLANRMTIDRIHEFGSHFGLGYRTGIDIPNEKTGAWPSRQWKRERIGVSWYPGDSLNVGVGQGYVLATPLQLSVMVATMASRGTRFTPQLVDEQWDPLNEGDSLAQTDPVSQLNVSDTHWDYVQLAMEKVIHSPKGTARRISKDIGYRMAGKTGTAQVISIAQDEKYDEENVAERQRDQALFVGYAPADEPQIAIAVVLENSGHGGEKSAPIARIVLDEYFASEARRNVKHISGTP
ncbi:penicillin-binding protein 2 [Aurantivibrio plasticivorans]